MTIYTVKKFGTGLHIILPKDKYQENQKVYIEEKSNQVFVTKEEFEALKDEVEKISNIIYSRMNNVY